MELEDHLFFLCTQVVYRRDRALGDTLKPFALLPTEWRTLGTLLRRGAMTMMELAQWTAYERTRLTRMLHSMEERRWVERSDSSSDGRSVVVRIAPKGEKLYRRAEAAVEKLTDDIMAVCPPDDIDRVRRSLQAMRSKLIEMSY
ncbi:MAG: MarR family winged helix-turn-helix transcriptional regulator [Variovorax sp.]